jgi:hypothetical protein
MTALKNLPWSRLVAEGVVVVLSILLAFAIDAWWSDRLSDAARKEWLSAIAVDFDTNGDLARGYEDRTTRDLGLVRRFLSMTADEASQIHQDSTWLLLGALWRPNPAPLNTGAILAALDAAPEFAASDDALRRGIADWRIELAYLNETDARLWALRGLIQTAVGKYPEIQAAIGLEMGDGYPVSGSAMARLRRDDEVMTLVAQKARILYRQLLQLEDVAAQAEQARDLAVAAGPLQRGRGAS